MVIFIQVLQQGGEGRGARLGDHAGQERRDAGQGRRDHVAEGRQEGGPRRAQDAGAAAGGLPLKRGVSASAPMTCCTSTPTTRAWTGRCRQYDFALIPVCGWRGAPWDGPRCVRTLPASCPRCRVSCVTELYNIKIRDHRHEYTSVVPQDRGWSSSATRRCSGPSSSTRSNIPHGHRTSPAEACSLQGLCKSCAPHVAC